MSTDSRPPEAVLVEVLGRRHLRFSAINISSICLHVNVIESRTHVTRPDLVFARVSHACVVSHPGEYRLEYNLFPVASKCVIFGPSSRAFYHVAQAFTSSYT